MAKAASTSNYSFGGRQPATRWAHVRMGKEKTQETAVVVRASLDLIRPTPRPKPRGCGRQWPGQIGAHVEGAPRRPEWRGGPAARFRQNCVTTFPCSRTPLSSP